MLRGKVHAYLGELKKCVVVVLNDSTFPAGESNSKQHYPVCILMLVISPRCSVIVNLFALYPVGESIYLSQRTESPVVYHMRPAAVHRSGDQYRR